MQGRPKEFERDTALKAATDVFWTQGFEAASMTQLLAQMKINRQSAYDTFGDKRALFIAALTAYIDHVSSRVAACLTDAVSLPSPVARVRLFLNRITDRACTGDGRGCLLTNSIVELAPHDPDVRALVSQALHRLERLLAQTLTAAAAAAELRPAVDPTRLARLLLTFMQGALVLSKTNLGSQVGEAAELLDALTLAPPPS